MSSLPAAPAEEGRRPGLRAALLYGAPTLAILVLVMLPVILGLKTLILRDILEVHLMLKAHQAEAIREGVLALIDPHRSGGQPLLGNPNAVPFYPDNLLFLVAPVLWVLSAHFWIHWLVAPVATYWMGRAWGLGRPAAWAAGVCYGVSGYFLSQLNLYNVVAGAALVPALVAAALRCAEEQVEEPGPGSRRWGRWAAPATGLLWALVLLSGDPSSAAVGGFLAASAVAVRWPRGLLRPRVAGRLGAAVGLGTVVALPQIVEFLRILPSTYRGYWGYADWRLTVGVWRPIYALEWLVPQPFGRYDLRGVGGFWASPLFEGNLPLLLSLYPGLLAVALVLASGRPRDRPSWWSWGVVGLGILLSSGGTHAVGRWLFALPGAQAFRYPVKLWMMVAVGAALLCGIGWQRTFGGRAIGGLGRTGQAALRRLAWPLSGLATALAGVFGFLALAPDVFDRWVLSVAREGWGPELVAVERTRWMASLVTLFVVLVALGLCLVLARRRPLAGAALLLAVHAAAQVHVLRGLHVTDDMELYTSAPPPLEAIPERSRVAHAQYIDLFGSAPTRLGPDHRFLWTLRQDVYSLIPGFGVLYGDLHYELARSAEGLESFLSRVAYEAVFAAATDADRVRGLSRWGVRYVISQEPLEDVPPELARLAGTWPGVTTPVHVYRLRRPAPDVLFAETELPVPHLNAAWHFFRSPGFDPRRHVVLPGPDDGPVPEVPADASPRGSPQGRIRLHSWGPESLEVETASPAPGVLVVQRSLLPIWRGTLDGAPAELLPANLYRIGVRVPAGRHRVRLWVDRRPLVVSGVAALLGLLGLGGWAALALRRAPSPADSISGS